MYQPQQQQQQQQQRSRQAPFGSQPPITTSAASAAAATGAGGGFPHHGVVVTTAPGTGGTGGGAGGPVAVVVGVQQQRQTTASFEPSAEVLETKKEIMQTIAQDRKNVQDAKGTLCPSAGELHFVIDVLFFPSSAWVVMLMLLSICASVMMYLQMEAGLL